MGKYLDKSINHIENSHFVRICVTNKVEILMHIYFFSKRINNGHQLHTESQL